MPTDDESNTSITVGVIRALVADVAELKRLLEEDRATARAQVEMAIVSLRQDFHRALGSLQIDNMDHRRYHADDRNERVARQTTTDQTTAGIRRILLFLGIMIAVLLLLMLAALAVLLYVMG